MAAVDDLMPKVGSSVFDMSFPNPPKEDEIAAPNFFACAAASAVMFAAIFPGCVAGVDDVGFAVLRLDGGGGCDTAGASCFSRRSLIRMLFTTTSNLVPGPST